MGTVCSHVDIDAPADQVWRVVADLGAYREWHPFIRCVSGALRGAEELDVWLTLPDARDVRLTYGVAEIRRNQGMLLLVRSAESDAIAGTHELTVEALGPTRSRVNQSVTLSRRLAAQMAYAPDVDAQGDLDCAARALKERVETRSSIGQGLGQISGTIRVVSRAGEAARHCSLGMASFGGLPARRRAARAVA